MDRAGERTLRVADRDADTPLRDAVEEVDGPVERVDDPAQPARSVLIGALLLREEAVLRAPAQEQGADLALGLEVGLADRVRRRASCSRRAPRDRPRNARAAACRRSAPPRSRRRATRRRRPGRSRRRVGATRSAQPPVGHYPRLRPPPRARIGAAYTGPLRVRPRQLGHDHRRVGRAGLRARRCGSPPAGVAVTIGSRDAGRAQEAAERGSAAVPAARSAASRTGRRQPRTSSWCSACRFAALRRR